jgi:hypothetical protein
MNAKTLTAKLPDGRIVSRKTAHQYGYVVACFNTEQNRWGALSWHHSYESATAQANSRWKKVYPQMRIVLVIENIESPYATSH